MCGGDEHGGGRTEVGVRVGEGEGVERVVPVVAGIWTRGRSLAPEGFALDTNFVLRAVEAEEICTKRV